MMLNRINKSFSRHLPSLYLRMKHIRSSLFGKRSKVRQLRLPGDMPVEMFFQALKQASANYAVLRRFEQLPDIDPGKSIELLVSDSDAETVRSMLVESSRGVTCDVFSVSGLPGSSYKNMPLFPPGISEEILSQAQIRNGLYRVPDSGHQFLIGAYRSVYHEGYRSGIPSGYSADDPGQKRTEKAQKSTAAVDAADVVRRQASRLPSGPDFTLEALDAYLAGQGWQPPRDMLSRYVTSNTWVHDHFFAREPSLPDEEKGLAVFVFREKAVREGLTDTFLEALREDGFELHQVIKLEKSAREAAKSGIRGGNWGRGSWPVSGGDPEVLVIACDRNPEPVPSYLADKYPLLDNHRLYKMKTRLRNTYNDNQPGEHLHCSVVHVTDNAREAWDYIETAAPGSKPKIKQLIYNDQTDYL